MILILFFYLLILHHISIINSIIFKFETSCTSSQFLDLENLIGSLHTSIPNNGYLIVRDKGLTNGQRKLLKRYQNIQIISSTYTQSETTRIIDVHHELILINNTLSDRDNQGKYVYIDSIRKQFYLAIVIPLIESQFNQLRNQLDMTKIYPPCQNHSNSIDLIFYHNKNKFSGLENNISQLDYPNECYRKIHYFAAELSEEENQYPIGSANMWKLLFINQPFRSLSLRDRGYTHFFLMEPDTRPIRSYWLDAIVEQIIDGHSRDSYISTKWWMSGSIYRGSEPIGTDFLHINGNALYHLSLNFISFITNVSNEYPFDSAQSEGYDLDLFLYLFKHMDIAQTVWHKFRFTDFIQNCWHTGCNDTNKEFLYNHPNTYLIHGQKMKQENDAYFYRKSFWIVLLGLILFILRLYQQFRWRFHYKRSVVLGYLETCKRKIFFQR